MSESSMQSLAGRLARGEEAAFAELYDAVADRVHHYLAARLRSRDAASDVLQITFLRAVKSRKRFRKVENPIAYLFQVGRNEAMRWAAKKRRTDMPPNEVFAEGPSAFGQQEDAKVVAAALERLGAD